MPQPDSPTSATTSPGCTVRLTLSTAVSVRLARNRPADTWNVRDTLLASSRGACPATCATTDGDTLTMSPPRAAGRPPRRSRRGARSARDADRRCRPRAGWRRRGKRRSHAGSGRRRRSRASRRSARAPCRGWCRGARRAACARARECRRAARACRDARGRGRWRRRCPVSTTWPAYMTTTRVAMRATMPRSWVISTRPMASSRCSSASRCRICAWMVTSSAVVGSSARISEGEHISAMAIMTRWRKPPESWWGYCLSRLAAAVMPTRSSRCTARSRASLARGPAMAQQRLLELVADGVGGVERGHRLLEDHGHAVAADVGHGALAGAREVAALELQPRRRPQGAWRQQVHDGERRQRLAAARLADDAQRLAAIDVKRHALHRVQASPPAPAAPRAGPRRSGCARSWHVDPSGSLRLPLEGGGRRATSWRRLFAPMVEPG